MPDGDSDVDEEEVKDAVAEGEAVVLVENDSIELCVPDDEKVPDGESRALAVFVTKGTVGVIDADTDFDTCEVGEIVTENDTVALVDEKNKLVVEKRALCVVCPDFETAGLFVPVNDPVFDTVPERDCKDVIVVKSDDEGERDDNFTVLVKLDDAVGEALKEGDDDETRENVGKDVVVDDVERVAGILSIAETDVECEADGDVEADELIEGECEADGDVDGDVSPTVPVALLENVGKSTEALGTDDGEFVDDSVECAEYVGDTVEEREIELVAVCDAELVGRAVTVILTEADFVHRAERVADVETVLVTDFNDGGSVNDGLGLVDCEIEEKNTLTVAEEEVDFVIPPEPVEEEETEFVIFPVKDAVPLDVVVIELVIVFIEVMDGENVLILVTVGDIEVENVNTADID